MQYDGSARLFQYITKLGISSYISRPLRTWKLDMNNAFVNKCIDIKELRALYKARPLVQGNIDKSPRHLSKSVRKIIPPKLSPAQLKKLASINANTNVALIAIPLFLAECTKKCNTGVDYNKHLIVIVLNKNTHTVEVFNDMLPYTTKLKGMNKLIEKGLQEYLLPKLQTLFPAESPALKVVIPGFKERYYQTFINTLADAGYTADNFTAYAAFIANYLEERVKDPNASYMKLHKRIIKSLSTETTRNAFFANYDKLHNAELHPQPCNDTKILNTTSLKCIAKDGETCRRILHIAKKEPKHTYNNINIHEYFIPADTRKHGSRLDVMEVGGNTSLLNAYLRSKYGSIAYIAKYVFKWNGIQLTTRAFKTIWEDAMTSPARYVIFNIDLSHKDIKESHANALIYDKDKRELERFEPHGGAYDMFEQTKLDEAIIAFFDGHIGSYLPPLLTCPIGLQDDDDDEINPGAKDLGGNCAVWALYYMELRLSNPLVSKNDVIKAALDAIKKRGSFRMFINAYHWHVQHTFRQLRKKK